MCSEASHPFYADFFFFLTKVLVQGMEQFPLVTAQQKKQWLFLLAAFSVLDTDLEAEAGPRGSPSPPPRNHPGPKMSASHSHLLL